MKKLIIPTLALEMAISLTACRKNDGKIKNTSPPATIGPTETVPPSNNNDDSLLTGIPDVTTALPQELVEKYTFDSLDVYFFDSQRNADDGDAPWRLNPEEVAMGLPPDR